MIGWWIVVSQQTPEERDAGKHDALAHEKGLLATWETGLGGDQWLDGLVTEGKAQQLTFGGYPNRFVAEAGAVAASIANGPPAHVGPKIFGDDYVMPANWIGKVTIHKDKLLACSPNQMLTIDVWDQS